MVNRKLSNDPVIIIGGGVIGLSIGWQLVRQGVSCIIIEKGSVGGEASSAAAGMITPASEVRFGEETLLKLFIESLESYPSFISELEKWSGRKVDFHQNGSLMVAIDHDDEAELNRLYDYQKSLNLPVNMISPAQVAEKEPLLSHTCVAAIEAAKEYFLDNRLLVTALKNAYVKAGGSLIQGRRVDAININNNRVESVRVGKGKIQTDRVVMATGIHTDIEGLPENLEIPIRPVKGQALEVNTNSVGAVREPPLRRAIRTVHRYPVYLVPRSDGRIIIGATNEEMGRDDRTTAGALLDLIYGAWKILPTVYEMEFTNTWVSHRATSRDHSPVIGRANVDGLYLAMGMYRHGILLTPIIGKLLSDLIAKEKESSYFDEFGVQRFQKLSLRAERPPKYVAGPRLPTGGQAPPAESNLDDSTGLLRRPERESRDSSQ